MIAASAWAAAIAIIFVVAFFLFPDEWKAILRALAGLLQKTKKFGLTGIEAQDNPTPPSPDQRRAAEDFFRAFDNPMIREQEDLILADLRNRRIEGHEDRERALVKSLAANQVLSLFERIHGAMWGSQYGLLKYINERPAGVSRDEVDRFYEAAKAAYPAIYEHYQLSDWFNFVQSYSLLAQNGQSFGISIRGRAYLQYVIAAGKREPTFG